MGDFGWRVPQLLQVVARRRSLLPSILVEMATFGNAFSFGVYQDYYTRARTSSASNISWIGGAQTLLPCNMSCSFILRSGIQFFLLISGGLLSGKLLDMGYFRVTMLTGSLLYTFSCVFCFSRRTDAYRLHTGYSWYRSHIPTSTIRSYYPRELGWGLVRD